MIGVLLVLCMALLFVSIWLAYGSIGHKLTIERQKKELVDTLKLLDNSLVQSKRSYDKYMNEKGRNKSVEVRTGQIMEVMAPFLEAFDHDPKKAHFLGQPIDYIVFGEDEIIFVEVKTGKSSMSKKQNKIKKLVEDKKVRFELVRFDYE